MELRNQNHRGRDASIHIRIEVGGEPSARLRAALEALASVVAEERGEPVTGGSGGLVIGAARAPVLPGSPSGHAGRPSPAGYVCIGEWDDDDGTRTCTIQWD